jgi:2'-5' RNA ligase
MTPPSSSNTTINEPPNEIDDAEPSMNASRPMRVFVGVRIASAIASELTRLARDLEQFPVRLVAMGDVHLTLVPPWNESSILEATDKIGSVAGGFCGFTLGFRHLGYGPNPERPRLLWAECDATSELTALRAALLQACGKTEERAFRPHVTVARLRESGRMIAMRCPIDREISFTQQVDSIELFRSPPSGGVGYQILASLPLGAGPASRNSPTNGFAVQT